MNVTQLAVRRPVTILMVVLGMVIAGLLSYTLLPVREMPSVHYPFLQITVSDPGADPQDIRTTVTDPLENALTTVSGIEAMTSVSMQGVSDITLQFVGGTDINTAANNVAQALHRVAGRLPSTATLPTIVQDNPASAPIMNLSLSGKLNQTQLYALAQNTIAPSLESVPGVASVNVQGGLIPQVNVTVHSSALMAYHVSLQQIAAAISSQNSSVPGGSLQSGPNSYTAATNSPYTTVASLSSLTVNAGGAKGSGGAGGGAGAAATGGTAGTAATGGASGTAATGGTGTGGGAGAGAPARHLQLGQLATITQGYASPTVISTFNSKSAVSLSISTASNANSLTVESGVLQALARMRRSLPPGAALRVVSDATIYTRAALTAVLHDLLLAIVLTAIVLFVFLRRISHTFIVVFAIPTSLIATFAVMYALGFSLDLISMLGLSLLIGILVDDSIVVLENIDRHLATGLDPKTAAVRGRMEIGAAAVAITLTDVVVYAPVAFVHGTIGQLLREFALTIVAATLFSLFVSFTLTPMLASKWLRPHPSKESAAELGAETTDHAAATAVEMMSKSPSNARRLRIPGTKLVLRFGRTMRAAYTRLLRGALRHRLAVLSIAAISLVGTLSFVPLGLVQTEYVPQENALTFRVEAVLPTGTSLSVTAKALKRFATVIHRIPSVSGVLVTAGENLTGLTATNEGVLTVVRGSQTAQAGGLLGQSVHLFGRRGKKGRKQLGGGGNGASGTASASSAAGGRSGSGSAAGRRGKTKGGAKGSTVPLLPLPQVLAAIDQASLKIPGLQIQTDIPNPLVISGTQPIAVVIGGPNLSVLNAIALQVAGRLGHLPGLIDVQNSAAAVLPEWVVSMNTQAAAQYGVSAQTVGTAVQTAISGAVASTFQGPGLQTGIVVSLHGADRFSPSQMSNIPIVAAKGQMITLGEVATVVQSPAPVSLNESNRQLSIQVTAGTRGVALGTAANEVTQILSGLPLPPGYTVSIGGQIAQQNAAFAPLLSALALSVALVYMLMAALYESLITPLVVLFSLPMATIGALLALSLTGETLNIFSLIALIMLMGLVAKNAILLVDYTGQLIARGYSREDALIEAGRTRLRPIVMTTATMVVSMIPLALPLGVGSSTRMPVATVLIGGMTTSTLLTLVVVPALYTYLDDFRRWLRRIATKAQPTTTVVAK